MILQCPSCSTRFVVDAAALGTDGRRVRCAVCSHTWFQRPDEVLPLATPPPDQSAGRPVDEPPPPGANLPAISRRGSSGGAVAWLVTLVLVVGGLAAAGYVGRDTIVEVWPPAFRLYETLGIPVAIEPAEGPPGAGLALRLETPLFEEADGGSILRINGTVTNPTQQERMVPPLVATLLDANDVPVDSVTFRLDVINLDPGGSAAFETVLADPHPGATQIEVTTASGGS